MFKICAERLEILLYTLPTKTFSLILIIFEIVNFKIGKEVVVSISYESQTKNEKFQN